MRSMLTLALIAAVTACDATTRDEAADTTPGPIEISVMNDGTVVLDDEEMTPAELGEALDEVEATRVVSVSAERDVTYGVLDQVQKALAEAGVQRVVFQSEME